MRHPNDLRGTTAAALLVALTACSSGTGNGGDAGGTQDVAGRDVPRLDVTPTDAVVQVATPVNVVITADNAYGFGYGDGTRMMNYFGGIENADATDIFDCPIGHGPEEYTVPAAAAPVGAYVYIVTWSDRSVTQGVLAEFRRGDGRKLLTGDPGFEVCATGVEYMLGTRGPTLAVINTQIARCNAGTGAPATTSAGWVDATGTAAGALAIGEANATPQNGGVRAGNEFPTVCGIDSQAKWMWFNWNPAAIRWPTQGSPFMYPSGASGNVTKQFLIFRLGVSNIPVTPG